MQAQPEQVAWEFKPDGVPVGHPIEGASVYMGDTEAVILLRYAETDADFAAANWKHLQLTFDGVKAGQLGMLLMQVGAGLLEGDPRVQSFQTGQDEGEPVSHFRGARPH
jgi:hypothetical protein